MSNYSKILVTAAICLSIGIWIGLFFGNIEKPENIPPVSENVTIGLILPITGDLASHGEENLKAAKLALADFNARLDKQGTKWRLEMQSEDSATNPGVAHEKINHLYSKGIDIIVGPETSENIETVREYVNSNNILIVSCCSTAPSLAIENDSIFRLVPDDKKQGDAIAKLIQDQGIKVIVPLWREDTWAKGLKKTTDESFRGPESFMDEGTSYNPKSIDLQSLSFELSEKVQKNVDKFGKENVAVLYLGFGELIKIIEFANDYEILKEVRWFGSDGITKEKKIEEDTTANNFFRNTQLTSVQFTVTENETYEKLKSDLYKELGREPSNFAYASYDTVYLIGLSILETNSTKVSTIKENFSDVAKTYEGAIGPVKLNKAGDLEHADYEIWEIRDGKWEWIGKYNHTSKSIKMH